MIRTTNVRDGFIDLTKVNFVDETTYKRWTRRQVPQRGDIVLTREAPLGEVGLVRDDQGIFLGQRLVSYRVNPALLDERYLLYTLLGRDLQSQVQALGSGATVAHMRVPDAKRLLIPTPPLEIQQRIGAILGAYDDLIEVNRRRIALVDEMARRTFEDAVKSFRDIEKAGTSASTLVATTVGGDWGGDIASPEEPLKTRVIRGTDFRSIQSGDFTTAPTRFLSERSFGRRLLRPFDLVVENSINAKTRNSGSPLLISAGVIEAFRGTVVATSFCRLFRCTAPESAIVLFHFMQRMQRNNEMQQFQVVAANGIANFQSEHFMKQAVVPLSPDKIVPLGQKLLPFAATTFQQQISILVQQRDLLLPRLISGELAVAAAERELEAVA
jgi:type I restriction enzyme, S subunit